MFLQKSDLRSTIYQYQLDQITEDDDTIVTMGIEAAIIEVKSCLTPSNKKEWNDGRVKYDAEAIFATTGTNRNQLILELTKTVAEWWIIKLCNADILFEQVKERYEKAVDYLNKVAKGERTITSLPTLATPTDGNGNTVNIAPFRMGGREKFNHE